MSSSSSFLFPYAKLWSALRTKRWVKRYYLVSDCFFFLQFLSFHYFNSRDRSPACLHTPSSFKSIFKPKRIKRIFTFLLKKSLVSWKSDVLKLFDHSSSAILSGSKLYRQVQGNSDRCWKCKLSYLKNRLILSPGWLTSREKREYLNCFHFLATFLSLSESLKLNKK